MISWLFADNLQISCDFLGGFEEKSVTLAAELNVKKEKIMAIDIKVIPTLRGEEAARFVKRAEEVMNNNNRVDFSAKVAEARAILEKAGF